MLEVCDNYGGQVKRLRIYYARGIHVRSVNVGSLFIPDKQFFGCKLEAVEISGVTISNLGAGL